MNNPYRARPTRSRVDHSAAYGMQNQNMWMPVSRPQSNDAAHQPPVMNQSKHTDNAWKDPWDWNLDQQSDTPQQQQQPQQQQSYVPPYSNQGQLISNLAQQDHYYKNINGDTSDVLNQNSVSGRNTPRTESARQAGSAYADSFPPYANYNQNQQYSLPPRQNTPKSGYEHPPPQWPNEHQSSPPPPLPPPQQQQNIAYAQQRLVPPAPPQNQPKDQLTAHQPPPPPPPSSSSSSSSVAPHNYNYAANKIESGASLSSSRNWQNYNDALGQWEESTGVPTKETRVDGMGNQCGSQPPHQTYNPPVDEINKEHSTSWSTIGQQAINETVNRSNVAPGQWYNQNSGTIAAPTSHQTAHLVPTSNLEESFNSSWSQGNINDWRLHSSNVQSDAAHISPWPRQDNGLFKESVAQDKGGARYGGANEWQMSPSQQMHAAASPFHYNATAPTAATVDNAVHTPNNNEQQESERQAMVAPVASSTASSSSHDSIGHARSSSDVKPSTIGDQSPRVTPDDVPRSDASSKNVPIGENDDNATTAIITNDLSSRFCQFSLGGKTSKHADYQGELLELHPSMEMGRAQQHTIANFNVVASTRNNNNNNSVPDNMPVLPLDYAPSGAESGSHPVVDGQPVIVGQDHPISNTYQSGASTKVTTDGVSQSGYDQWYNQSALSAAHTVENAWYAQQQDHARPSKQWSAEQNVENYENIQQTGSDFVNVEVVTPATLQERDIYGSRDSINKETLDNDPKPGVSSKEATNVRDFREEASNVEVVPQQQQQQQQQQQARSHPPLQMPAEQMPDNYEFASNDRNTFLETGELTDSHQEHEPTPPSQDDENDEVPNDIPFLREVPGQSSTIDPRRNDPTGQEQYVQTDRQRLSDPRRNDPSGQEQSLQVRGMADRTSERRDVPPGQERNSLPLLLRVDSDTLERRNDPSGRERSLPPPSQSRNDPSGEERYQLQAPMLVVPEPGETREVPGRGNESEETAQQTDGAAELRQIPGGASSSDVALVQLLSDDRTGGRVVTGSQDIVVPPTMSAMSQDQASESRSKREEAVGASLGESQVIVSSVSNRRDSYEDMDDDGSGDSRDGSRERRRDASPSDRRRYGEYDRKGGGYYERDREYEDDYYYDRRRVADSDRQYGGGARDDFDRRDVVSYRDDERKHHSRDDLDRHGREDMERRVRGTKEDLDERDGRRRPDDRRRDRADDPRRRDRDSRDYDARYPRDPRDRDYMERERRRDDRRSRRYDDYDMRDPYRREYYDDPYGRGSRPSSRSSYNDRDREYYMRARDPYYAYNGYGGYDYGTHYGNNYYAYLENLRRTNPAAYSEWYHKYYASQHQQQHIARGVSNYPEDRASVHSGRSSCDDRTTGDKRTLGDMSLLEDSTVTSARLTPTKYSTSHAYGCFSIGSLVHVHPSYPADGDRAKVDIFRVDNLLSHDSVTRELRLYPGPLINGVTHKKTIIEYCENKIKKAVMNEEMIDRASYILLYELMIMLIQQNGNVVGVDIATLLLRNKEAYPYDTSKLKSQDVGRRESLISQRSGATGGDGSTQDISTLPEKTETKQRKTTEQITDEFRNTLLYGLVQEALEYAMNEGLWGHALFLASKLDKRTHASVMTRFANSLPPHDPLQTLYQLHSGRVPAIVTCVADPRWDDWRPHLAMIISNTSANPEVNRRSITTLGDTLSARGDIHAAHFCYILAQIDFGAYGTNGVKLVLIGANHNKPYSEFLTTEAVMLTEIYEYARNLSDPYFTLIDLQTFKFDLVVKMVDCGLIEKALLYIEQIATNITNDPSKYKRSFTEAVYALGDRIKYHDPVYKDSIEDATNLIWLNKLAEIVGKYQGGEIVEDETYGSHIDPRANVQSQEIHEMKHQQLQQQQQQQQLPPPPPPPPSVSQQQWSVAQPEYGDGPVSMMEVNSGEMQSDWQPLSLPANIQDTYDPNTQYMRNMDESMQYQQTQQQTDYWNQQPYYQGNYGRDESTAPNWQQQVAPGLADQTEIDNTQQKDKWNYETEREDKTPTPEVSNCILTPDNNLDPEESSDATAVSSLRRRNVFVKSNPCFASIFNDSSSNGSAPTFANLFAGGNNLEQPSKVTFPNSRKSIKYPKLTASYPKILQNNKVYPRDIRRPRHTEAIFSKPPCSQPPVFLKCKIKRKSSSEDTEEEAAADKRSEDEKNSSASRTTDLDIQFSKLKLESLVASDFPSKLKGGKNAFASSSCNDAQTLKQYCNFEEKKVMRVAPHIRRKDVICDTVDAWSYDSAGQSISESSRYKPLVFGGTYPIDLPLRFRNNNDNHQTESTSDKKTVSFTYDIDIPTKM